MWNFSLLLHLLDIHLNLFLKNTFMYLEIRIKIKKRFYEIMYFFYQIHEDNIYM